MINRNQTVHLEKVLDISLAKKYGWKSSNELKGIYIEYIQNLI